MKALVLAGGSGSRLRPLTLSMPKQLIPVANEPVLRHCLRNIRAMGIRQVGVVEGEHGDQIRAALGDGAALGLDLTYIRQDTPAGLAHCVRIAAGFLGNEDFVLYLGDNVVVGDLAGAAEEFRSSRPAAKLLLAKVADPSQYGVAGLRADGNVRAVVEKSPCPPSDLAIMGVYFFTPEICAAVDRISPSPRGELEITDAIQYLIDAGGTVSAQPFTGLWKDTGTVEGLLACNRLLLDGLPPNIAGVVDAASVVHGDVTVESGARVTRSVLRGPLVLGAGSVVEDSVLGPYVALGPQCRVRKAVVRDSILLGGSVVRGGPPVTGEISNGRLRVTAPATSSAEDRSAS
ncbi:glucose-1-phosphate thymidylyltransferase [Streptomyces rubradiris]|uniref:Glucose-1-phosphate thymidylyltransferase n=2 Tax=Streptomyces rubradiris TaxID=285531 RepID=Q2PC36_STRRR|nr:glucose-1-phosphate thymidylyltransferase [Streptomyces rubradiris]GHI52916.1 glucose-1-phosphate thymidylyltransferase [Streptomyces rubradiris]GHI58338.1 glucose-1-phosphate thymidylyltransferase [Streptomyces rubradiris]CAI94732.1 putative TDP-glucose synthase [Streptomyces rubradiris]